MTPELAERSYLPADDALNAEDATTSVRTYASKLFAEIAVRTVVVNK